MSDQPQDQASFARDYAQTFNLPAQGVGEDDLIFRYRIADALVEKGNIVEAEEARHNQRYEDNDDVIDGITGLLALALAEAANATLRSTGATTDLSPNNATQRIRQLSGLNKRGVEIAQILLNEGYDIQVASDGFYALSYVVKIAPFMTEVQELHVSDFPLKGFAAIIALKAPLALPSVVWEIPKK